MDPSRNAQARLNTPPAIVNSTVLTKAPFFNWPSDEESLLAVARTFTLSPTISAMALFCLSANNPPEYTLWWWLAVEFYTIQNCGL